MIRRHAMFNAQDFLSSRAFSPTAQIFSQTRTCSFASKVLFMKHELWSKLDLSHSNKGAWTQLAACEFAPGFSFAFIWIYAYFEAKPPAFHLFIMSCGALAAILLRWEIMSPLNFSFMMPSWAEEQLMSPESNSRGGGRHRKNSFRLRWQDPGKLIRIRRPSFMSCQCAGGLWHKCFSPSLLISRFITTCAPLSCSVNPYHRLIP